MHTCSTWSENVCVVLGLLYHYFFFQLFPLFQFSFYVCDMMMWVVCGCNSSYRFIPNVLKLSGVFIMVSRCAYCLDIILVLVFVSFFLLFPLNFFRPHYYQNNLCVQLQQFATDYYDILQAYSTCSEDMRLLLVLSSLYFLPAFSTFLTFFFFLVLFPHDVTWRGY